MKKKIWLLLFIIVFVTELVAVIFTNQSLPFICKPLLMPLLAFYFLNELSNINSRLKTWVLGALFFSWAGDVLLLFADNDQNYFLAGLISFLVAHIFYILTFHRIRKTEYVNFRWWILVLVSIFYLLLMIWLSPYLGEMKWPVRIYGFVICTMFLLAAHLSFIKFKSAGTLVRYGATLFVISDFLIATNKFYGSFELIDFFIMLTYGLAQLLIVMGISYYLRFVKSLLIK